jgi:hypothetical protein
MAGLSVTIDAKSDLALVERSGSTAALPLISRARPASRREPVSSARLFFSARS